MDLNDFKQCKKVFSRSSEDEFEIIVYKADEAAITKMDEQFLYNWMKAILIYSSKRIRHYINLREVGKDQYHIWSEGER